MPCYSNVLVPNTPELSELARGDRFFIFIFLFFWNTLHF